MNESKLDVAKSTKIIFFRVYFFTLYKGISNYIMFEGNANTLRVCYFFFKLSNAKNGEGLLNSVELISDATQHILH